MSLNQDTSFSPEKELGYMNNPSSNNNLSCSTGKNQYSTQFLAEMALIEIHIHRNFPPERGPQNVYQCEICGSWHLTSKALKRNKRLQEMIDSGELRLKQQARQWE